ncbi:thioredoxin domain-containing protein [Candidatus Peregrinibacteria bacterium]|nr:thioredoxin domain-containing protein [Candidatus Peregrinibacteria bacterium]
MKRLLFVIIGLFLCTNAAFALNDIAGHPFEDEINALVDLEIIDGYPDGTFKPDNPINRAEFVKLMFSYVEDDGQDYRYDCFDDVNREWFAIYVCTANFTNIIDGYADGNFKPSNNINFAESAKIVAKFYNQGDELIETDTWYEVYIDYLDEREAIPYSLYDQPGKLITRAEMAYILDKVLTNTNYVYSLEMVTDPNNNPYLMGEKSADITMHVFFNYECVHCKSFHDEVKTVVENSEGEINASYWNLPFSFDGSDYEKAVAGLCIGGLGGGEAYYAYIDLMLDSEYDPGNDYSDEAVEVGVDEDEFQTCMDDEMKFSAVITQMSAAQNLGIKGTPYTIISSQKTGKISFLPGYQSVEHIESAIEEVMSGAI